MANFRFETISAAEAANYSAAADSLGFEGGGGAQITVAYVTATGGAAEHVMVILGGRSMAFGTGIYGDQDLRLGDGSMLYVGGLGADAVAGTALGDGLYGGQGGDNLAGGEGGDLLQGNQGEDMLQGGLGNDSIYGGADNDTIHVGVSSAESNWSNGNRGEDFLLGAGGADTLLGGQGADTVDAGDGDDLLVGNLGDDILSAGAGADTLIGEGGLDMLTGGDGADVFNFGPGSSDAAAQTLDTIQDWTAAERIHIDGASLGYTEVEIATATMPGGGGYGYDPPPPPQPAGYAQLLERANSMMATNAGLDIVAARVGFDVVVFADSNGDNAADLAIVLTGATLLDISAANFF